MMLVTLNWMSCCTNTARWQPRLVYIDQIPWLDIPCNTVVYNGVTDPQASGPVMTETNRQVASS